MRVQVTCCAASPSRHFGTDALCCDCQLRWLLLWARSNAVKIGNDTVCMFPAHLRGLGFRSLRQHQLHCGKNLNEGLETGPLGAC